MGEDYGLGITTSLSFEEAVARTRLVLRAHGFGVLSDMRLSPEPDSGGRSHIFMGLWEHPTSSGNLGLPGLEVGDHLACNVVVFEQGAETHVAALDPTEGMEGWEPSGLAGKAKAALEGVLEEVGRT